MRIAMLAGMLLLPFAAQAQLLQYIAVGAGAGCDVATVAEALALARSQGGPAEIRIARNRAHVAQAVLIEDASYVALKGGYDDCLDSSPEGRTTIDGSGNGAQPVLSVGFGSNADVFLERLDIRGGGVGAGSGGGIAVRGRKTLTLHGVSIDANSAQFGGGLYIERTQPEQIAQQVILTGGTSIGLNNARIGGGIYSLGGLLEFRGDVRVHNNNAGEWGGGIYLDRGSRLIVDDATIDNNYAGLDGGGLYVEGGSSVTFAVPNNPSLGVHLQNQAQRHGGSIYARAVQGLTRLDFSGYVSVRGSAGISGAAIYLDEAGTPGNPARVQLNWNEPPPERRLYSSMSGSSGSQAQRQGALVHVSATHGTAQAVLRHLLIRANFVGEAFRVSGRNAQGGAQLYVSDSEIIGSEQAGAVLRAQVGDLADFSRITLGASDFGSALFGGELRYLRLHSSVIYQPGSNLLALEGDTPVFAEYLLVHDSSDLPNSTSVLQGDPRYINDSSLRGTDLRLQPDSPALDFAPVPSGVAIDLDGNPRVADHASITNAFGPLDLGAYELVPGEVFHDGFESPPERAAQDGL